MSNLVKYSCLLAIVGSLLLANPLIAAEGVDGALVSARWLEQNLKNSDLVILDASQAQTYALQHIAGALSADLLAYGVQEIPAEVEQRCQAWGISPGKKVVIYDESGGMMAARLFFSLYYHGFPLRNLSMLNGGLRKWQEEGFPVTSDATPAPAKGSFKVEKLSPAAKAELPEVVTASGDPVHNALIEALGANWHFGEVLVFDRAGHIPNGILAPASDFYNSDGTFKSAEEIERLVTYLGVRPEQTIYTYCGGGVAAAVPFFALKFILGYPNVKLYAGSEMEWLADERQLPYWTYDAPFLMRTTGWLRFWGGPIIRMYLSPSVSIVDVRPPASYGEGHVPFALNIPADVFKSNVTNPAKLAEILGPAGVDASQEAVVVSGAGLTKESALAFLMLERLGQKRVSVFIDPLDRWTQPGSALTKDPTAVGPKKGRQDLSIPPTTYAANLRKDIVITDAKTAQGLYPTVFIASGASAPAKAPEGKVVHVPYSDLLNADGTPKAAKDIWNILVKAGVPRYAELVCFSDDLGEAAANYFILKLMGFPDVKVLLG
jgi:thiosulfate/3-mercaptopyruvate sulfurtransferase